MPLALILTLAIAFPSAPPLHYRYRAADGTFVRRPYHYKTHPRTDTPWNATCRDGSLTFTHVHRGACSHHGGVRSWR